MISISKKLTKAVALILLGIVLCSSDKKLIVTWDRYNMRENPDVKRLAIWEVDPDTNWVRTIEDYISPYDTTFTFMIPQSEAYGVKYFTMVAVDSAGNRSEKSNIVAVRFRPATVTNLNIVIY